MEQPQSPRTGRPRASVQAWLLAVAALVGLTVLQGWLTLDRFGADQPWERLCNDDALLAGRHPLHLYHGYLGAKAFRESGNPCCFDPAFQAGYPKTPVFDGGSRPAELFLTLGGGGYRPAAYKIGLFVCCCLVPLLLAAAAASAGLCPGGTVLATVFGLLTWWAGPCRALLDAGDLDFLLVALAVLLSAGPLLQLHVAPAVRPWLAFVLTGALGWFADPLLYPLLLAPLVLVYYLSVGVRHGALWHVAVGGAALLGLAANGVWLFDWVDFWWLRSPLPVGVRLLHHRTLPAFGDAPLWSGPADRALTVFLFASAGVGLIVMNYTRCRPAGRMFGLGAFGLLGLALAGLAWELPGRYGAPRFLTPALWFAAVPAACAWLRGFGLLRAWWRDCRSATVAAAVLLGGAVVGVVFGLDHEFLPWQPPEPWQLGFDAEQRQTADVLTEHTNPGARILWEDGAEDRNLWAALLPLTTSRSFLGGLMPDASVEFAYPELSGGKLGGRPLTEWTDAALDALCRRYNVGWVACRSAAALERFGRWPGVDAARAEALPGASAGRLYPLRRPASYVLKGTARWLQADSRYIILGDVVPEDGVVVLSLHYQAGLRVMPDLVQPERDPDPTDPTPFLRLRMPGPVTRLVLSWEKP